PPRQLTTNLMAAAPINFLPALVSSLVAWRVYRRVRRNIGRQPFQPRRLIARASIFAVITIGLIAFTAASELRVLLGLLGGLVPGIVLAWFGLRLTRFESTPEGRFYTPNTYIGVGLSLLMVGRVLYRLMLLHVTPNASDLFNRQPAAAMKSPLTFFIFGLLAGYYMVYLAGVLMRCRKLAPPAA
ncbi:MAG TPA: hypothetical protein VK327_10105, partial [Candidatus Paceibacterota bacterium]|nr:hypothetical protein [Candidatus Paceibacterota bacterium]